MPQKLHDSPAHGVRFVRVNNPLPYLDIIVPRPLENLLSRHGKLCTTSGPDKLRHAQKLLVGVWLRVFGDGGRLTGVQRGCAGPLKDVRPHLLCNVLVSTVACLAARVPVAAEIHVAVLLDKVELESTHGGDIVMEWRIHVPSLEEPRAMRVEECNGQGKCIVIVDHIGQISHGFVALVYRGGERKVRGFALGRIHDVNRTLPTMQLR